MSASFYFDLFQILFSLFAGFYLARRARPLLRKLVVQLTPVKKRVSDDFVNTQIRRSTIAAIVVAILIALLLFWGTEQLERSLVTTESRQRVVPLQPSPPKPGSKPENTPTGTTPPTETDSPEIIVEQPPQPSTSQKPKPEPKTTRRSSPPRPEVPAITPGGHYYLQLYAFDARDNAERQYAYWSGRMPEPVLIIYEPGTEGPYKVLLGPFDRRSTVVRYRRARGLEGFVKKVVAPIVVENGKG